MKSNIIYILQLFNYYFIPRIIGFIILKIKWWYTYNYIFKTKTIKLKEIWNDPNFKKNHKYYDWEGLENSIRKNGFQPKYGPKLICQQLINENNKPHWELMRKYLTNDDIKYTMKDGAHRIQAMKNIYGLEHKITLKVYDITMLNPEDVWTFAHYTSIPKKNEFNNYL